jgi:hypothetical protein
MLLSNCASKPASTRRHLDRARPGHPRKSRPADIWIHPSATRRPLDSAPRNHSAAVASLSATGNQDPTNPPICMPSIYRDTKHPSSKINRDRSTRDRTAVRAPARCRWASTAPPSRTRTINAQTTNPQHEEGGIAAATSWSPNVARCRSRYRARAVPRRTRQARSGYRTSQEPERTGQ